MPIYRNKTFIGIIQIDLNFETNPTQNSQMKAFKKRGSRDSQMSVRKTSEYLIEQKK